MKTLSRQSRHRSNAEGSASGPRWAVVSALLASFLGVHGCDTPVSKTPTDNAGTDAAVPQLRKQCEAATDVWTNHGCVQPAAIKLNTVGYPVGRRKIASVPADAVSSNFIIRDITTQEQVYSGELSAATLEVTDAGDSVRTADFTAFDEPGTYELEVAGLPSSPPFEIGDSVYNEILKLSLLGFYGQRCGTAVTLEHDGDTFSHGICHKNDAQFDATMVPGSSGSRLATGGWHDAGDYGKYTVNGAFSVAFLLKAWEDFGQPLASVNHIPDYSGTLPPILAEAKFELDWLLLMQTADGSALHLVCPKAFPGDAATPEGDKAARYFLKASSGATSYFVAATAMGARAFRAFDASYADTLLLAAQSGMAWLTANPDDVPTDDGADPRKAPYVAGGPYGVNAGERSAARTWATVELWRANGGGNLTTAETALNAMAVPDNWDWAGPGNFALFDYAASDSTERDAATITKVQTAIAVSADRLAALAQTHGYGRALGAGNYYWGSAGLVARSVMNLQAAYRLSQDAKYLDAATSQLDYLLGRNPFGRSLVTGLGFAPPVFPHHRPSTADRVDEPWPGLLIGGPNKDVNDPMTKSNPNIPAGKAWYDLMSDYYVNEVAINWNAALVYAASGFVK